MRPPKDMTRIIDRRRYSTATATLLAGDDFWDGHNFERRGRNDYLYRTPSGRYFVVGLTQWQGEQDTLTPVSLDAAVTLFEDRLTEHRVEYDEAFPDVEVLDAERHPPIKTPAICTARASFLYMMNLKKHQTS